MPASARDPHRLEADAFVDRTKDRFRSRVCFPNLVWADRAGSNDCDASTAASARVGTEWMRRLGKPRASRLNRPRRSAPEARTATVGSRSSNGWRTSVGRAVRSTFHRNGLVLQVGRTGHPVVSDKAPLAPTRPAPTSLGPVVAPPNRAVRASEMARFHSQGRTILNDIRAISERHVKDVEDRPAAHLELECISGTCHISGSTAGREKLPVSRPKARVDASRGPDRNTGGHAHVRQRRPNPGRSTAPPSRWRTRQPSSTPELNRFADSGEPAGRAPPNQPGHERRCSSPPANPSAPGQLR